MNSVQWLLAGGMAGVISAGVVAFVAHRWRMALATAHWRALTQAHDEALAQALERERLAIVCLEEQGQAHDEALTAQQARLTQAEVDLQVARKSEAAVLEAKVTGKPRPSALRARRRVCADWRRPSSAGTSR